MKYNVDIEIDDKAIKDSGMDPDDYIRQEMGWLEDSGISLVDLTAREEKGTSDVSLYSSNYSGEYRGGVEWRIAKDADLPIAAYIPDRESGNPLIEIREMKDTSLVWGEYELRIGKEEPLSFDNLDEAVDAANAYIRNLEGKEAERYPVHELAGHEGIFHVGKAEGKQYIINAFWSDVEPGYVNDGVFALGEDGRLEILTSEFCNGYLTTEDCVRTLVGEHVPIENPDIQFVAICTHEFDTADDYYEALEEGRLEEPIHIPSWTQIAERNLAMRDNPEHETLLASIMESARNETPEPVTYKGVPLEGLDKEVSMAHSHFIGANEGIDYLTALLARDKQALTPKQFEAMSALNSVAVMNYQVCNGGLDQYYFNQCHKEREPFSESDVKLVNKEQQVEMLRELHAFGCEVFPDRQEDNARLDRIIIDFEESSYTEPAEGWLFDEEEEDGLDAPYDFDDRYYEVNDYLEILIESYAQYLDKSIEKSLDELVKEAKAKAAEKNAERTNPPQQDLKGIDR